MRENPITLSQCGNYTQVCRLMNEIFGDLKNNQEQIEDLESRCRNLEKSKKKILAKLNELEPKLKSRSKK
jgi:chromosome segregation ATPase